MSHNVLRPARVFVMAALLSAVAAFGLDYASSRFFGPTAAFVHVRWAPNLDALRRDALELRFCLTAREPTEGTTYSYLLVDTSTANIRALIAHPEVLDTHDLDRSAFTVSDAAERVVVSDAVGQRRSRQTASAARLLWRGAAGLAVLALLFVAAPTRMHRLAHGMRAAAGSVVRGLYSRIPEVSAEGAALFRIVFGGAVVILFAFSLGSVSVPPGPLPENTPWLTRVTGGVFIASPHLADFISPWLSISGALFVVGAFTRLSFAAFTLGAIAWGVVYSLQSGHHPISALLIALICLVPSSWGDAWSIDVLLRRPRHAADPREYGYTVWIPGVVLGIALAAAAASKLSEGGIGWILNGTVKYHFLTDAPNAPVDWGVRFALVPSVAVALSFGALATESLVVVAAVIGPWRARLVAALAVIPMFVGFWLFQGVFWPSWWVLLLSFAPWHLVPRSGRDVRSVRRQTDPAARRILTLRYVQAAFFVAAVGQQLVASAWRLEVPPVFSAYDMYSKTYATPEEYPPTGGYSHRLVAIMADETASSCRIGDDEAKMLASLPASEYTQRAANMLASCFGDLRAVRTVTVEQTRPNVDWAAGRYLGTSRVRLSGPVALASDEGG